MDPATPAALIVRGTLPDMEVVQARVADLAAAVREHAIKGPTTIIIGKVVSLRTPTAGKALAAT
jgi:siroheme synthase